MGVQVVVIIMQLDGQVAEIGHHCLGLVHRVLEFDQQVVEIAGYCGLLADVGVSL